MILVFNALSAWPFFYMSFYAFGVIDFCSNTCGNACDHCPFGTGSRLCRHMCVDEWSGTVCKTDSLFEDRNTCNDYNQNGTKEPCHICHTVAETEIIIVVIHAWLVPETTQEIILENEILFERCWVYTRFNVMYSYHVDEADDDHNNICWPVRTTSHET